MPKNQFTYGGKGLKKFSFFRSTILLFSLLVACSGNASATSVPSLQLDLSDFPSVVQWVSFSIDKNKPEMISDVIGQNGTQFWSYATGAVLLGHNNAEIIVAELKKGLNNSAPQCLGYNPDFGMQPDKAIIVFKDINFDWPNLGLGENKSGIVGLQFFRMEQGWELVFITPIPTELWPGLKETLIECP